jgi:abortive infection alpha-like protein
LFVLVQVGSSTNGANHTPPAEVVAANGLDRADPPPALTAAPGQPAARTPDRAARLDRTNQPAGSSTPSGGRTEAVLVNAGRAAGWLAHRGWRVTRRLPGGEVAERQLLRVEDVLVTELRRAEQMVAAELRRRRALSGATTPGFAWRTSIMPDPALTEQVTVVRPMNGQLEPLRASMAELLGRSAVAGADQSREYLYATILRQLLPDEARILAALADGTPRPVVHVATRNSLGGSQRLALENASTVGRDAGVTVTEHVPFHLTRLHHLGLVDIGPEDPGLADQYAILIADDLVRRSVRAAKHAKLIRRSVRMSDLGHRFWTACDPLTS